MASRRRKSSSNPIADVDLPKSEPALVSGIMKQAQEIFNKWLSAYVLRTLALTYGLFVFFMFASRAVYEGLIVSRPSKSFWSDLEKGRMRPLLSRYSRTTRLT